MRILYVLPALGVGGAEVLVKNLAISFIHMGYNVSVLTMLPDGDDFITKVLIENGVKIIRCPAKKRYSILEIIKNLIFLVRHFKNNEYDVIHTNLTWDLYNLAVVSLLVNRKLKLVTTEHNTVVPRRDNFFIKLFFLEYLIYKRYLKVVCITEEVFKCLTLRLPFLSNKCIVINNGVPLDIDYIEYDALKKINYPIILCIGTLCERKQQRVLIEAVSKMSPLVELWIVGDGPDRDSLGSLVKKIGIEKKVKFLGKMRDVFGVIKQATIYVQASLHEGLSISMLEAMVGGLPMVVSDAPGMKELTLNVARFFPVGNVEALTSILDELLKDHNRLQLMSKLSRQRAGDFSIEKTANGYLKLYEGVISSHV